MSLGDGEGAGVDVLLGRQWPHRSQIDLDLLSDVVLTGVEGGVGEGGTHGWAHSDFVEEVEEVEGEGVGGMQGCAHKDLFEEVEEVEGEGVGGMQG